VRAVHLLALSAFAIGQPIFAVLAKNPDYFTMERLHGLDIVVYGVVVLLVPPVLLMAVEAVAGLINTRVLLVVHQSLVAVLAFLAVGRALHGPSGLAKIILALAAAAVFAWAYRSREPVRTFVSVASLGAVLFLAVFFVDAPIAKLSTTNVRAAPLRQAPQIPVVVVIFDEFATSSLMRPNGSIDAARYPSFAALARSSTWYRSATTVNDYTTWAVPAILTGLRPRYDQLPLVSDYPRNLFTLLGSRYRIHAFEPLSRLCPSSLCRGSSEPFGTRVRSLVSKVRAAFLTGEPQVDVPAWRDPPAEVNRFLAALRPTPKAQLDVLHVILPHSPWRYLPSGRSYDAGRFPEGLVGERWVGNSAVVDQAYQRHLLQVGLADRELGRIVRRLRATGLWDRALVVVTADEGVTVQPGVDERTVDQENIGDIAPVPLFVKTPGQRLGRVDDRAATVLDVVPTVVDVLKIRTPWTFDGRSLLDPHRPYPSEVVLGSHTGAVVRAPWSRVRAERDETIARKARVVRGLARLEAELSRP
jgi:hypothetical protein